MVACLGTGPESRLRMSMQQEVATHQALTPKHRRRRALAAALHNAPAQEGSLLLAALCSAASGQRCTRRTHGVLSEPRGGGRPSEREPHRRPCPAQRRASGTEECNVAHCETVPPQGSQGAISSFGGFMKRQPPAA